MVVPQRSSRAACWIAVAAAFTVGCGRGSKWATSVDDLVKRTFAALSAGDLDALVASAGVGFVAEHARCETVDDYQDLEVFGLQQEFQHAIRREMAGQFEVLKIETRNTKTTPKGTRRGDGCTWTSDLVHHELDVTLAVTRAGTRTETHATVHVRELDGAYLLANAPQIGGCSGAIDNVMMLEQNHKSSRHLDIVRCTREKWSEQQITCVTRAITLDAVDRCMTTADSPR